MLANDLAGFLKVIKRGGGMMMFFLDFWIELLVQTSPNGGPVMAYNEDFDNIMTSDGISTEDWEVVQDYPNVA